MSEQDTSLQDEEIQAESTSEMGGETIEGDSDDTDTGGGEGDSDGMDSGGSDSDGSDSDSDGSDS